MIYFKQTFFSLALFTLFSSCVLNKQHTTEERVKKAIKARTPQFDLSVTDSGLISKKAATKIAKRQAFENYGFWNISLHERPFDKIFIGNYLYLSGTLRKGWKGGVCEILVDRKSGKVVDILHGK